MIKCLTRDVISGLSKFRGKIVSHEKTMHVRSSTASLQKMASGNLQLFLSDTQAS